VPYRYSPLWCTAHPTHKMLGQARKACQGQKLACFGWESLTKKKRFYNFATRPLSRSLPSKGNLLGSLQSLLARSKAINGGPKGVTSQLFLIISIRGNRMRFSYFLSISRAGARVLRHIGSFLVRPKILLTKACTF
jgi:hypothetical protein